MKVVYRSYPDSIVFTQVLEDLRISYRRLETVSDTQQFVIQASLVQWALILQAEQNMLLRTIYLREEVNPDGTIRLVRQHLATAR